MEVRPQNFLVIPIGVLPVCPKPCHPDRSEAKRAKWRDLFFFFSLRVRSDELAKDGQAADSHVTTCGGILINLAPVPRQSRSLPLPLLRFSPVGMTTRLGKRISVRQSAAASQCLGCEQSVH